MSDNSDIEWTDATWNPIRGCSRVSAGCKNCYAERVAARFSGPGMPYEGLIKFGKPSSVRDPRWSGEVRMVPEHLADPLRWRRPRRVFVNSMSDLFHESLTNEQIAAVFGVMAAAPRHTFQVLTKRAARMRAWFEWAASYRLPLNTIRYAPKLMCAVRAQEATGMNWSVPDAEAWPLPHVWLGVSVENQDAADERIPELLRTPAAVRWLSCEPLLGPLNLNAKCPPFYAPHLRSDRISWIVAGCESGPGARPCDVAWLRSLRDQCAATGTAFFLKQAKHTIEPGNYPAVGSCRIDVVAAGPGSKRKPSFSSEGGGVIGLPYLDGRQHTDFPEAAP